LCRISLVIHTPINVKRIKEKSLEKRRGKERSKREVKKEERGYIAVFLLKNLVYIFRFLVIYIPATLYLLSTSNHLIFSTIASLV